MNGISDIDYEQVINLIKSILSLEYCLQYQIIPLTIEQGCLSLGMVNPDDRAALDFIHPIVNALGYGLTIQPIDSDTHQLALAEYLKHNHTVEQTKADISPQTSAQTIRDSAMTVVNMPFESEQNIQRNDLDSKATIIADPSENPLTQASLEDSKSTIYAPMAEDSSEVETSSQSSLTTNPVVEIQAQPIYESKKSESELNFEQTKDIVSYPFLDFDISTPSANYCLTHESLNALTPQQLWQELFNKILDGSIEKLHLEPNQHQGSILWSPDEVVRSSLDNVSLSYLQALINEIKTIAKIPLQLLTKPRKVAIEKHYQQERLQLRIDACPGQWGDEITIQVLRGKALKLYEQKQIKKMSEQALLLAQKLEKTLSKMVTCFESSEIGDLSELKKVKQKIDRQLDLLNH
ncbi:MAG: hypothetical protein QNJ34_06855 [Xenococcaceae cyanobacterium MO_188.B29]|nr:hypothetical protein [Xenococcaceae cyanobacterium MO_188.B29]